MYVYSGYNEIPEEVCHDDDNDKIKEKEKEKPFYQYLKDIDNINNNVKNLSDYSKALTIITYNYYWKSEKEKFDDNFNINIQNNNNNNYQYINNNINTNTTNIINAITTNTTRFQTEKVKKRNVTNETKTVITQYANYFDYNIREAYDIKDNELHKLYIKQQLGNSINDFKNFFYSNVKEIYYKNTIKGINIKKKYIYEEKIKEEVDLFLEKKIDLYKIFNTKFKSIYEAINIISNENYFIRDEFGQKLYFSNKFNNKPKCDPIILKRIDEFLYEEKDDI